MEKRQTNSEHELIDLLNEFHGYPEVQNQFIIDPEFITACQSNMPYYAGLIKAFAEEATDISNIVTFTKLLHLLSLYMPQNTLLWCTTLLDSSPSEIKTMYSEFSEYEKNNSADLNAFFQEINAFITNEHLKLNEQQKINYFKLIMAISAKEIPYFKKLTSLLNTGAFSLSFLFKKLQTISLSQIVQTVDSISDTALLLDLLSDDISVMQVGAHITQKPKEYLEFINHYATLHTLNKMAVAQLNELYQFLEKKASSDQSIWRTILLAAKPTQINRLHQWMNRYQHANPLLFLNLIYSKTHQLDFDETTGLKEEAFLQDANSIVTYSAKSLFSLDKPLQFSVDRVRLIHHLEKKTFVVSGLSTIKGLWTELKNSSLLTTIYACYSRLMIQNQHNKDALLLIAKELTAVPNLRRAEKIDQQLKADLSKVVSKYLHSFWIRTQRQNSAKSLLRSINGYDTDYLDLLNAIHNARNEVFTNDTEKERHMHRFGSSRYYQTLNQLENILINNWVQNKNAVSDFKQYLNHYKTTLDHSKQCLFNAIKHENSAHHRYNEHTPLEKLPGYIKALKKEAQLREASYQKYEQLLMQSEVDGAKPHYII